MGPELLLQRCNLVARERIATQQRTCKSTLMAQGMTEEAVIKRGIAILHKMQR